MAGGNTRGPLPEYMRVGRGNIGGPVVGCQMILSGHIPAITDVAEAIQIGWQIPFDARLYALSFYLRDINVGATQVTIRLYKNTSFSLTGATALLNSGIIASTALAGRLIAATAAEGVTPGGIFLAAAARDIPRDSMIFVSAVADNAAGVDDLAVHVVLTARGFSNNDPSED